MMTVLRLLDTSVVSNYLKRNANISYPRLCKRVEEIVNEQGVCLSIVTIYELQRGLKLLAIQGEGVRKIARTALFLQEASVFGLEAFNGRGWEVAAEIYAQGKARSPAINLSEGDLLVASTAIAHGRVLLTTDASLGGRLLDLGFTDSVEVCSLD